MTSLKFISAVSLILALGVCSFARYPISKNPQIRENAEKEFKRALKSYTDIQDQFNQTLAGRFPFSDLPEGAPFAEADPASISAFFDLLAKNKEAARSVLKQSQDYNKAPDEALKFLEQMEKVGLFFAAFLNKKQVYPLFDFNLRFRVNEEGCRSNPNQIIDRTFEVGEKRFHYRDTSPAGIWGYGEPLKLSLRWANDAPAIPAFGFNQCSPMKLEGQTVTLTYNNNWSLLYLILRHRGRGEDFRDGVDHEPYTLKIGVPTQPNPKLPNKLQQAQLPSLRTTSSIVFISIGLMTPGGKDPLMILDFPTSAPPLTDCEPTTRQRRVTGRN